MKINLDKNQINNLLLFLDRVELKGIEENKAYMDILQVLDNPIMEKEE